MARTRKDRPLAALIMTLATSVAAAAAPGTREDQFLTLGILAGSQTVTPRGTDTVRAEYSFNDRGRGDHIIATWKLDTAGVPIEYSGSGNDYMKAAVTESFRIADGKATWSNRAERGEKSITGEAFYVPANAPPEFTAVLARALFKAPGRKLALLPEGEARITSVGSLVLPGGTGSASQITQYEIAGLDFGPTRIWLDHDGNTAASVSGWSSVLPAASAGSLGKLTEAQDIAAAVFSAKLAKRLTHIPAGDLLIRNARLFDPRDLSVTPGMSVLIRDQHVIRVARAQPRRTL